MCGGTHYFIQHFLFPPGELSFERSTSGPKDELAASTDAENPSTPGRPKSPVRPKPNLRWQPPGPHPPIDDLHLSDEQVRLLDTFWTNEPVWRDSQASLSSQEVLSGVARLDQLNTAAGRSTSSTSGPSHTPSRPTVLADAQLLALHDLLKAVDPREAGRWHWRDGRKVRRGLERWWEGGSSAATAGQAEDVQENRQDGAAGSKGRKAR